MSHPLTDTSLHAVAYMDESLQLFDHRLVVVRRTPRFGETQERAFFRFLDRKRRGEPCDASMMDADWLAAEQALQRETVAFALIALHGPCGFVRYLWAYEGYRRDEALTALAQGLCTVRTTLNSMDVCCKPLRGMESHLERVGFHHTLNARRKMIWWI